LKSTNKLLKQYCPALKFALRHSSIAKYRSREKFDIVLCEAVVPTQKNPPAFLRHVAGFVRPGGVLVITCMDAISLLPEMLRRWLAWDLVKDCPAFDARVARLADFFRVDLAELPGMSRRPEDWVIDQILHPWAGPLFSIPEAVAALGDSAMILGSSPRFLIDWRWYKNIFGRQCGDNSFAANAYYELGLNLMDCRVRLPQSAHGVVKCVESLSEEIYERIFARERGTARFSSRQLLALLKPLANVLRTRSPATFSSVKSFISYLRSDRRDEQNLQVFRKWWGRGQQYLSCLIR
jgi:SAM-dependent methyltransferase